jgi:hypothetical protein
MTVDLVGVAAVIAAIASPLSVVLGFITARRVARQKAHLEAQDEVLADVKHNTDGILSAEKTRGDALAGEVERVAIEGTPTEFGEPDAERHVRFSAGKAITHRPEGTPSPETHAPPKPRDD